MPTQLIHCSIYASAATRAFETSELAGIPEGARRKNARLGLTGMLLFAEGNFLQILEGSAEVVDSLFAKIERDERHANVTKIIREPIPNRSYESWTMGFHKVSREELVGIAGVNDFVGKAQCFDNLDAGRAKKLLAAYGEGSWRKKLSGSGPMVRS